MTKSNLLEFLVGHGSVLPEEIVHVPEWGRDVILRGLSSRERDDFEASNLRRAQMKGGNGERNRATPIEPDLSNFRGRLVAAHIVEDGERLLSNQIGEDLLGDQPASVIDPLFAVAQRLSGFSVSDIKELQKNSEATVVGDQSSDLPESSDVPSLN